MHDTPGVQVLGRCAHKTMVRLQSDADEAQKPSGLFKSDFHFILEKKKKKSATISLNNIKKSISVNGQRIK